MEKSTQTREYAEFVKKLKKARVDAGFTQIQVAEKLDRPQSYISNIESGQQRVDIVELQRFARVYKKDVGFFIP